LSINKINGLLALLGNLGVIAGLVFLTLEMQQSNRIAMGSAETDLRSQLRELTAAVYENPDLTEALLAARSDVSTLSDYQYYLVRVYA
jgi:hypothetical protein